MKKILFLIFIWILFFSCDIKKRALKTKTDRTVSELKEKTFKRQGDTVTYKIPKITYKDTTIYTTNRQGTVLRTVYDNKGMIDQIDCFSSLIDVTERSNKLIEEVIKDKNKEKEEDFDSSVILFFMIGLALIVLVVAFLGFRFLSQNSKALNLVLSKLQ